MDWSVVCWFVVGLGALVVGAEWLVGGAARLAARLGMPPLVIGLTVVAFGTSAPELAVSVKAAVGGEADMAVGNVVGSNICNVLLILGSAALITPLRVARDLVWRDIPFLIALSGALWWLAADGRLSRLEAAAFCLGIVLHTAWILRQGLRQGAAVAAADEGVSVPGALRRVPGGVLVVVGLVLLVLGAQWLVDSAVVFARWAGVGEAVIGLTLVAVGTSLPELMTSIVAAFRGERDIAVGNVVGSNVFNILCVLGVAGAVAPDGLAVAPSMPRLDLPVMTAAAVACLPLYARGHTIPRWQGLAFLLAYAAYVLVLVLPKLGA